MIYDDDSEAAHLDEISDEGCEYTREEKRAYLERKANAFQIDDIGKFVVTRTPDKNKDIMPVLYMVNRHLTKDMWWSPYASLAMVFNKQEAAKRMARRLKYGQVTVKIISKSMTRH